MYVQNSSYKIYCLFNERLRIVVAYPVNQAIRIVVYFHKESFYLFLVLKKKHKDNFQICIIYDLKIEHICSNITVSSKV